MNMSELRSLARERNLRGYCRLRKADLINLLRTHIRVSPDATLERITKQLDEQTPLTTLT